MKLNLTPHPALYVGLIAACVCLLLVLIFRSTQIQNPRMRLLLFGLRAACLAILLLILADPVRLDPVTPKNLRTHTLFLIDTSQSMGLGAPATRLDEVRQVVEPVLDRFKERGAPSVFRFDTILHSTPLTRDRLPVSASGDATHLGQALLSLIEATQALGVASIVVFSDGRIHDADRLSDAVRLAKRHDVAISTYVAGTRQPVANAAISNCIVERHAPPGSRIPLRALIRCQNVAGRQLRLTLGTKAGRAVGDTRFEAREGLVEQEMMLDVGNRTEEYVLELSRIPNETTAADNTFAFRVEVYDPKTRVLYMEGSNHKDTRWDKLEYEFIAEALRETGRIDVDVLTVDEQVASGGRLYRVRDQAAGFPATREELFDYDVVICSDINRFIFTPEQLQWTVDLVAERGGGFCMIGGYTAFGAGGWDQTSWEKMIPMDMKTLAEGYISEEFTPLIPEAARGHPILQMDADKTRNDRILDAHPPLKGTNLVNRAKPGATVLAVHPGRQMPILSVQAYGKGRTMAFTSDAAGGWGEYYQTRWGEGEHDNRHYRRFWVNAVRWLSENSMSRRRTELMGNTEAITYQPGEVVRLRAQIVTPARQKTLLSCRVTARFDGNGAADVLLQLDREKGEFRGDLKLPDPLDTTEVQIVFSASDGDGSAIGEDRVPVRILHLQREFAEMAPDPERLAQLAQITGGAVIKGSADLTERLARALREQKARTRYDEVPLWDRAWLWALLVLLLSADWTIRKMLRAA